MKDDVNCSTYYHDDSDVDDDHVDGVKIILMILMVPRCYRCLWR